MSTRTTSALTRRSPVRRLPTPAPAAAEVIDWCARRGVGRSQLAVLSLVWPLTLLLAWVLTHPNRTVLAANGQALWMDGHAYWAAWSHMQLYALPPRAIDAYLYSPAFAELLWPLTLLSFAAFAAVWWSAIIGVFWWLLAPLPWAWRAPALILTGFELKVGNVHAFLALMLVLSLRRPGVWSFALLTKITPGVGLLWFAARREWQHLAEALAMTAAVVAVSAAASPGAWSHWLSFLVHQGQRQGDTNLLDASTLVVRLPLAAALVVWGARTSRPWTLAVGVAFATPLIGLATLTILAALPRLVLQGRAASSDVTNAAAGARAAAMGASTHPSVRRSPCSGRGGQPALKPTSKGWQR